MSDEEHRELTDKYVLDCSFMNGKTSQKHESADRIRHFHMGSFKNADEERETIQFWKGWWAANKALFAAEP